MTMLRELQVDVAPVLASDRSRGTLNLQRSSPGQGRFIILQVKDEKGQATFLDPGCRYCAPGIPDWRHCSTGPSGVFIERPSPFSVNVGEVASRFNSEVRRERVDVSPDGLATISGSVSYGGQYDVEQRRHWTDLTEAARQESFLSTLGRAHASSEVTISDPESVLEPLTVNYELAGVPMIRTRTAGSCSARPTRYRAERAFPSSISGRIRSGTHSALLVSSTRNSRFPRATGSGDCRSRRRSKVLAWCS